MNYDFWKQSLAGEKPKMFVDDPQLGFYRRGVYEKVPNKAAKRGGWSPVAIFPGENGLVAAVGLDHRKEFITDRDRINELWSYCAAYPITEEWYRAVAERGEPWPDSHESDLASEPSSIVPGKVTMVETPEAKIAREVDECTKQIIKYAKIESDEQSAKARSLQQRFLDLRGDAKKHYDEANNPLLEQQRALREIWFPLRDLADAGSVAMRTAMGKWEDTKREAAKLAAEAAEKARREHEEAAAKAAAANQPAPPPPEPAKPNVPPPATQIRGGAGRAGRVTVQKIVTAIDVDKVFQQFRDDPRTVEFLTDMAQRAVKAGITVPGATVEEKSDVR